MASTYSDLKLELMATGANSTTWGTVTNTNLDTALGEAITGSTDVTFASTTVTLTLTNTNAAQQARNLRLNLIGTSGGAQNLIVPAIEKAYIINNGCADAITVKNASGTGIAVPAGKTMWVYNDATNVVNVATHLTSLTLAAALPVASGGTGLTTTPSNGFVDIGNGTGFTRAAITAGSGVTISNGVGTITIAATGSGGTVTSVATSGTVNGITLTGGTITSTGTITLGGTLSGVSLTSQVTGTLPVANGGTGGTTQGTAQSALDVPSRGGSGASGSWGINVTGSSASCTGNAATATNGITTGNIGSYAPGLTGSGASGTWGINVTGNAATATNGITTGNIGSYAPGLTGSGASGTWGISISGNAATASNMAYSGLTGTVPTWNQNTTGNAATATTATTATTANALNVSNSYTAVDFTATSDTRLKDVYGPIIDALDKVDALSGFYYRNNDKARSLGQVKEDQQVGLSAQDLHEVLPEAVSRWSVDPEYLVVAYDRVIPLLVEAIKELRAEVKALKG